MNQAEKAWCESMYRDMSLGVVSWKELTEYQTVLMADYIDSNRDPITYERPPFSVCRQ